MFVDNAKDVQIADTIDEQKEFGKAYARGILKTLGIAVNEPSAPVNCPRDNGQRIKSPIAEY